MKKEISEKSHLAPTTLTLRDLSIPVKYTRELFRYFFLIVTVLFFTGCHDTSTPKKGAAGISKPVIFENEFPKTFFFRQTEVIENYMDYEAWEDEFDGLMGIMGKALNEEKEDRTKKSIAYYSQFKKDNPDKIVLLHYNGNACDPRYETGKFFDGHWLYHNGVRIAEDLPESWNVSKVKVEDASLFSEYTGREFDRKEDVAIVKLDDNGKPDWFYCEQAVIRDIDYENNVLTIARAQYRTRARSFEKGKAMIAAHVIEGPWGGDHNNLMWYYNHSTECPKDAKGKNCADIFSEIIADRFKPGGDLYYYDGIELDVLFRYLFHHSYCYLQNWGEGKKVQPDCNGDGIGDMGVINGIDTYEKGVAEFVRKTRKKLEKVRPGILFMADAGYKTQRSFNYLNGVETEGYGKVEEEGVLNWSHLVNIHGFWNSNYYKPNFSYLNHRLHVDRWATHRVAFSSAMYSGSAICQSTSPPRNPDGTYAAYDEFVKGEENELAWMGEPKGPAVHLVLEEKDLIDGEKPSKKLLKNVVMKEGTASLHNNKLVLKGDGKSGQISFIIPDVAIPTNEFTLKINSTCEPMKEYYPEMARIVSIIPVDKEGNSILDSYEWWFNHKDRRWGYINDKPFTNYFFFHHLPVQKTDVKVIIESTEPVFIESLQVFAAPDAMYREFEKGLVITNPGLHPYIFDLPKLSPENSYRRIKGTESQDIETNNGKPVSEKVTLEKHDALFLIKE